MQNDLKYELAVETIDRNDLQALSDWMLQDQIPQLTMGSLTKEFESRWNNWLGRKYSIACNSGSSANLLMYSVLREHYDNKLLRNDIVVVPSTGWATTIMPAIQLGFRPVMCEADPDTLGLDLNYLEDLLKRHQPATVIMVQVLGIPHKMNELMALKNRHGFLLLEDACASVGSSYEGQKVGIFGDMASFSFYFGHQSSTIEGGMVSTDNRAFYNTLAMLRSHGWGKDTESDFHEGMRSSHDVDNFHSPFVFYLPGYNLRLTDLQSFLGIRQIDKMEWVIRTRFANHLAYSKKLEDLFFIQKYTPRSIICSIHFAALAQSVEERKVIVAALEENHIETRLFTAGNLGRHPFWTRKYGLVSFPMADKVYFCGFFLPNNTSLKIKDVHFISDVVRTSVINFREEKQ